MIHVRSLLYPLGMYYPLADASWIDAGYGNIPGLGPIALTLNEVEYSTHLYGEPTFEQGSEKRGRLGDSSVFHRKWEGAVYKTTALPSVPFPHCRIVAWGDPVSDILSDPGHTTWTTWQGNWRQEGHRGTRVFWYQGDILITSCTRWSGEVTLNGAVYTPSQFAATTSVYRRSGGMLWAHGGPVVSTDPDFDPNGCLSLSDSLPPQVVTGFEAVERLPRPESGDLGNLEALINIAPNVLMVHEDEPFDPGELSNDLAKQYTVVDADLYASAFGFAALGPAIRNFALQAKNVDLSAHTLPAFKKRIVKGLKKIGLDASRLTLTSLITTLRTLSAEEKTAAGISDAVLQTLYGLRPLSSDVNALGEGLVVAGDKEVTQRIHARKTVNLQSDLSYVLGGSRSYVLTAVMNTFPQTDFFGCLTGWIAKAKRHGIYPDLMTAYDSIPWSFLADMVVQFGDFLDQVDTNQLLSSYFPMAFAIQSVKTTVVFDASAFGADLSGQFQMVVYHRWIREDLPMPPTSIDADFRVHKRGLEISALAAQRL